MSAFSYADGLICFSTLNPLSIYTPGDLISAIKDGDIRPGGLDCQWAAKVSPASNATDECAARRKAAHAANRAVYAAWAIYAPGLKGGRNGSIIIGSTEYTIDDVKAGTLDDWAAAIDAVLPDDIVLPDPEPVKPAPKPAPTAPPTVKPPSPPVAPKTAPSAPATPHKAAAPTVTRPKPLPAPLSPPVAAQPPIAAPSPAPAPSAGSPVIPAADFDALARLAPLLGGKVETVTVVTLTMADGRFFIRA